MAPIPKTMAGILVEKTGGPEVLQYKTDLPVPTPKEGEILVQNEYIGINYIDTYFRTGLYPAPKPEILGKEAEGTVIAVGPSTPSSPPFSVGDRVVWMASASYAEFSSIPASAAVKIPSSIPPSHAAASILQGLTALTLCEDAYAVQPGDWILVHAAAGGVGLWLCQILKAKGAKTIGTVSTEAKAEKARSFGADVMVVGYEQEKVLGKVKEVTGGVGVAAVFDGVGQATFETSLEAVARKGSVASFGNASGAVEPFKISRLAAKNVKLIRSTLFNYVHTREELEHFSNELFQMMAQDHFKMQIHKVYPLEDVQQAHKDLEGRKTSGKLLMKP